VEGVAGGAAGTQGVGQAPQVQAVEN
jgi:hypothetical protein